MALLPQVRSPGFAFSLDPHSGVPVYRQLIDQVQAGVAAGSLNPGEQLPTVRQVAVDLTINPNTVQRAYREMEIRGILETQQGTGTFISSKKIERSRQEHERKLAQFTSDCVARAGAGGFTVQELIDSLRELIPKAGNRRG
jgi:GntR family transcriptional regulator